MKDMMHASAGRLGAALRIAGALALASANAFAAETNRFEMTPEQQGTDGPSPELAGQLFPPAG